MTKLTTTRLSLTAVAIAFMAGIATVALTAPAQAKVLTPEGSLAPLAEPAGCLAETGRGGKCIAATGLDVALDVEVSPDGQNVYAFGRETVSSYARHADGTLTPINCVSEDTTYGQCAKATGLEGGDEIGFLGGELIVSPDGRHVYVYNDTRTQIVVFERRSDGSLAQVDGPGKCLGYDDFGGECTQIPFFHTARDIELSGDGRHMYVAVPWYDLVIILQRDAQTGYLSLSAVDVERCLSATQPGCKPVSDVRIKQPVGLAISPDDRFVYISSNGQDPTTRDVLASFSRNATSGELSPVAGQGGCVSPSGSGGECLLAPIANSLGGLTPSPDGRNVYASGRGRIETDPQSGEFGGSVESDFNWGRLDDSSAISPDGRFVYSEGQAFGVAASGDVLRLDWATDQVLPDFNSRPGPMAISPDGRNVYAVLTDSRYGESMVRIFNRTPASLALDKVKRRANGTAVLKATVPEAGTLAMKKTKKLKGRTVGAEAGGQQVRVKVVPSKKTERRLDARGRATVALRLTFTVPTGQATVSTKQVKLKRR
jgi:6-phosphogluconolactonase (cycloisomerase 2 family)